MPLNLGVYYHPAGGAVVRIEAAPKNPVARPPESTPARRSPLKGTPPRPRIISGILYRFRLLSSGQEIELQTIPPGAWPKKIPSGARLISMRLIYE